MLIDRRPPMIASTSGNWLSSIEQRIFDSSRTRFVAFMGVVALIKCGIGVMPNLESSWQIADYPFANPITWPERQYLYWNWLHNLLAWTLGLKAFRSYVLFHLVFSLCFTSLFIVNAFRSLTDAAARTTIILFFALPVSSTLYYWVGMDSVTLFILLVALVVPGNVAVTAMLGLVLGMQHFEQGFVASAALVAMITVGRLLDSGGSPDASRPPGFSLRSPLRFSVALLVGVLAGKGVLIGVFSFNDVQVNSGRAYWISNHLDSMLRQFFYDAQVILWSALGVAWLAFFRHLQAGRQSIPFALALVALMVLLPITEDQTRVFAIVTFPIIAVAWLMNAEFLASITRRDATIFLLIWIVVPWSWTWKGIPQWSAFPRDVVHVLQGSLLD